MIHRCHDVAAACRVARHRPRLKTAPCRRGPIRCGPRILVAEGLHSPSPAVHHRALQAAVPIRAAPRLFVRRRAVRACCGPAAGLRVGPAADGGPADRRRPHLRLPGAAHLRSQRDDHRSRNRPPAAPEDGQTHRRCRRARRADPGGLPDRLSTAIPRELPRGGHGHHGDRGGGGHGVPGLRLNRGLRLSRHDRHSAVRLGQPVRPAPHRPSHQWPAVPRGVVPRAAQQPGVHEPDGLRPSAAAEPALVEAVVVRFRSRGLPRCRDRRPGCPSRCWPWRGGGGGEIEAWAGAAAARQCVGAAVPGWRRRRATRPDQPTDLFLMS